MGDKMENKPEKRTCKNIFDGIGRMLEIFPSEEVHIDTSINMSKYLSRDWNNVKNDINKAFINASENT
jgi:hypothetical protein